MIHLVGIYFVQNSLFDKSNSQQRVDFFEWSLGKILGPDGIAYSVSPQRFSKYLRCYHHGEKGTKQNKENSHLSIFYWNDPHYHYSHLLTPHLQRNTYKSISLWFFLWSITFQMEHYSDVIMIAMASQNIGVSIVYSIVCSGVDQRKHQSSASLDFVREIHRSPVKSPHTKVQ